MVCVFLLGFWLVFGFGEAFASNSCVKEVVIENFDQPLSGRSGVSVKNVMDDGQDIRAELSQDDALSQQHGRSLMLIYDVDSAESARVDFWFLPDQKDFSSFQTLQFFIKADPLAGGSKNVTLQITDGQRRRSSYILSGIGKSWKRFEIPIKRFNRIRDWSDIREITLSFDDVFSVPKEGVLLIDEITATAQSC